jgi:hypothetical protein
MKMPKFRNIAIQKFDIVINLNTIFEPQYPALLKAKCEGRIDERMERRRDGRPENRQS